MKIKNGILTLLFLVLASPAFTQSHNVTSGAIIFKQYNSEKDKSVKALKIKEAKEFIDKAYINESTSNEPKMWMVRAKIYKMIALYHSNIDSDAIFKATESHLKCMQPHPKKKNKIIIYKKWDEKEVINGLIQCASKLFNLATVEYNTKNYQSSLKHYAAIFDIIPFDEENQLKYAEITKEIVLYRSFLSTNKMKDNAKSKELLLQLIDINSTKPVIYSSMSDLYIEEGDNERALEYLTLGRKTFKTDPGLITYEIDLYIKLGKTEELLEKLTSAIKLDSNNAALYLVIKGDIYREKKDVNNALDNYKMAIEVESENFKANYISGVLIFNKDTVILNQSNETSNNSLHKKLKIQSEILYKSAIPYLLKAYQINPQFKDNLATLKELYYRLGDYKKSEEMKKLISELK